MAGIRCCGIMFWGTSNIDCDCFCPAVAFFSLSSWLTSLRIDFQHLFLRFRGYGDRAGFFSINCHSSVYNNPSPYCKLIKLTNATIYKQQFIACLIGEPNNEILIRCLFLIALSPFSRPHCSHFSVRLMSQSGLGNNSWGWIAEILMSSSHPQTTSSTSLPRCWGCTLRHPTWLNLRIFLSRTNIWPHLPPSHS